MSMALIPALNCTCLALRTLLASVTRALNELAPLGCATAHHRRSRHPVLTPPNSQPNQFPFAFCHPWGAEPTIPNRAVASCSPVTKGATFPRRLANAVPALPGNCQTLPICPAGYKLRVCAHFWTGSPHSFATGLRHVQAPVPTGSPREQRISLADKKMKLMECRSVASQPRS